MWEAAPRQVQTGITASRRIFIGHNPTFWTSKSTCCENGTDIRPKWVHADIHAQTRPPPYHPCSPPPSSGRTLLRHSTIPRQWKLLEILSSDPRGFTVRPGCKSAVSEKTIRRDLILLRQSGFDVSEIVEQFGRKRWRIRHPFDAVSDRPQRYRLIRDSIRVLRGQAEALGDALLAAALEAIEGKIRKKCEDEKPAPR